MNLIPYFLPDFRRIVKSTFLKSEENVHAVNYYDSTEEGIIYFYKPIGSVIYMTIVIISELPEDITVEELKREFQATEIPFKLGQANIISNGNSIIQY